MSFKVGDKVRTIKNNNFVPKDQLMTISSIWGQGPMKYILKVKNDTWYASKDDFIRANSQIIKERLGIK